MAARTRRRLQSGAAANGLYHVRSPGMDPFRLGADPLTLEALADVARGRRAVALAPEALQRMEASRAVVEAIAAGGEEAPRVYGVNTGFGALAEVAIGPAQIRELQRNLVRSHA